MNSGRLGLRVVGGALLAALLWPVAYAVWVSFSPGELLQPPTDRWSLRWYRLFVASPRWTQALSSSLVVAGLSVAVSLLAGTSLALAVTRYHFSGRRWLSRAVLLPLFVPGVVLGMGLLPLFQATGLWGWRLSLALAHALGSLPVVFLVLRAALEEAGPDLEMAARGLGATPWRVFWRVTLPLVRPALLAGAAMSFILSLNEVVLALFLATPHIETLPRIIWAELRYTLSPLVAVASCISVAVTIGGLLVVAAVRRLGFLVAVGRGLPGYSPSAGSGLEGNSSGSHSMRQQPRSRLR
jgi:ABC-type spermidine/putrescine transport system permease subunit II